ncbi:heme biosynthesis protein HemY [Diaphorobacter sp. HDW4A]|uniref:heme biosynthesis HemY N-terminal domain-containing protein n=1 Tax=Diaphorobacter sp. HDW4A TaxID=2714924 RepID=UPI001409AD4B|nr:heme biosynthesis HemY N-terminal domain-containing protein [Diaphorobacter sp. HDW4A]QIL81116.1 heme biosynthesis protein HemY [Diaphorobacter sp. HDW4A]
MRAALWLLALFGVAVAVALFAGNNQGTVTLFWPPYRVDLSLNAVLLILFSAFAIVYGALRGTAALLRLPRRARRWRLQQKERAMHASLLDAMSQLLAGRFLRARKAAETSIAQENDLSQSLPIPHGKQLRTLAHIVAAESSHALQDRTTRETHLQQALDAIPPNASTSEQELREGAQLRAARWSLDERDANAALDRMSTLSAGAARRTLALRAKLKASRMAHLTGEALDTARLLGKHRAFSPAAAESIVRSLAIELINDAHDPTQLQSAWMSLDPSERAMPELSIHAAQRLSQLDGDPAQVRHWLLPVWERMVDPNQSLSQHQAFKLIEVLEANLSGIDATWLARIESAQQADPRDARLQYLSAVACLHRELWGKAQQLFTQAAPKLADKKLRGSAWRFLAELAEHRNDEEAAAQAWKQAAIAVL